MDLKEWSCKISNNLAVLRNEILNKKNGLTLEIEVITLQVREAAAKGDLSENAEYTSAVEKLSMLNMQLMDMDIQFKAIDREDSEKEYRPMGLVILYATVKINIQGKEYIFKLYPEEVSDIEKNIVAKNSPIGEKIWLKSQGDIVSYTNKRTGKIVTIQILEIY